MKNEYPINYKRNSGGRTIVIIISIGACEMEHYSVLFGPGFFEFYFYTLYLKAQNSVSKLQRLVISRC